MASSPPLALSTFRRPFDIQRNVGSDMSMMALVQTGCPSRFASSIEHRIKGLNTETIARICLPTPPWLMNPEYAALQSGKGNPDEHIYVSLNVALYNQQLDPSDWTDQWFFMAGRVHPYALTWQTTQLDGLETEIGTITEYTIPAFIVRESSFQPILPRNLTSVDAFPSMPPTVSLTGPVIGFGHTLLRDEVVSTLGDIQMRCCSFIQLSSFITPGDPVKPFRGFHPFQVFIIFPIHANPWSTLCRKMIDRQDSHFQTGAPFTCAGKVVGLLDHAIMTRPPELERDHVFIIVPDTWTFLDRNSASASSSAPPPLTPTKTSASAPASFSQVAAGFTTTFKQQNGSSNALPSPDASPKTVRVVAAGTKRPRQVPSNPPEQGSPIKQPRFSSQSASNVSSTTSSTVQHDYSDPESAILKDRPPTKTDTALFITSTTSLASPTRSNIIAAPTEAANRPHRSRQPSKKVQESNVG
ncbi:hypothetical protein X797_012119 [Metarhizium robertsii]|uniref:Uncharacterized protein n=2 Tax=Metarhizium robertsii TaxID=568076 RepID=E9FDV5_METRA|nr:uncharacterized protein MAA_10454 [Metarhizium robertsii ARSEF 23]EFY94082.1 hypothetical protein MAA_10454 [Metarhizium robertsii ARSEF 23]EXU94801.1 hypothetical protein X797_012119 [Metarhizium robertsii]